MNTKKTKPKRNGKPVRLACQFCERDDYDGISHAQLRRLAEKGGWEDVVRYQSYADASKLYDNPADAPADYCVLDWFTHLGVCPDCKRGQEEEQQRDLVAAYAKAEAENRDLRFKLRAANEELDRLRRVKRDLDDTINGETNAS